jgi:hypothetical protein
MVTLTRDSESTEEPSTSHAAGMIGVAADEQGRSQPMPRFAAAVRALVKAYMVAIFALVVLRGIDAFLHG